MKRKASELSVTLAGESVLATAQGALVWGETLFVADLHFGKDSAFRSAGRPLPHGTTADDLGRLTTLIDRHAIRHMIILGDAFHSEHARETQTFDALRRWTEGQSARVTMVPGNHDRRATGLGEKVGWQIAAEGAREGPWILRHHPAESGDGYVLCGHIHPAVRLRGAGRESLRLPCFVAGEKTCILPAFGGMTGGHTIRPRATDQILVLADGEIIAVRP